MVRKTTTVRHGVKVTSRPGETSISLEMENAMNSDEQRVRNLAKAAGLILRKRRGNFARSLPGGYLLIDPAVNGVVAGATPNPYGLSLEEAADFISSRA